MSLKMIITGKKFGPLFWTQFLGALVDNVLKNALVVLVTFKGLTLAGLDSASLVALASGLFILPFFLFSPIAGQLSDKVQRAKIVRATKLWELGIMSVAAVGFWLHSPVLLLGVLFLAGTQATVFGPVKYSMVPDLVDHQDLIEANAYIEFGTFLAILIGTIAGGVLISLPGGEFWVIATLIALSVAGLLMSYRVPDVPVACPELKLEANPLPSMSSLFHLLRKSEAIFNSILGISWFWFFGAAILSVLPAYCKDFLGAGEQVVTCFLAMFTCGIGIGSILCEKLSFKRVELGLVPIGSIGMTIFLIDLFFVRPDWVVDSAGLLELPEFLASSSGPRLLMDFLLMSVFGGFFILPLYTLIQERSDTGVRSRIVAANNIVNALFMVIASLVIMALHALGVSFPAVFLILGVLNMAVAFYIYSLVPEFTLRFWSWVVARALYRIQPVGSENIPKDGPAVLVCNHVSFVDWLIVSALVRRPVRFVMYYKFFNIPLARYLIKQAKVIPICGQKENPKILEAAFDQISAELEAGELVCIFPEGEITRDGEMGVFKSGVEKILARNPVPVIPMALQGVWGTFFSRSGGGALRKMPRHWLSRISLVIGPVVPADKASAEELHAVVRGLLQEKTDAA